MADFKDQQQNHDHHYHPKTDYVNLNVGPRLPFFTHKPPKPTNKCFFYTFAAFATLCLCLLIFALVFLRPKPLPLLLSSPSLHSLNYNTRYRFPSFQASLSATLSIHNPNFGPVQLTSASLSLLHLNETVGSSDGDSFKRIGEGRVLVKVEAVKTSSFDSVGERNRLRGELNSGVLGLKGFVNVTGEVILFNRIRRPTAGELECDIVIDLRSKKFLNFACSKPYFFG